MARPAPPGDPEIATESPTEGTPLGGEIPTATETAVNGARLGE